MRAFDGGCVVVAIDIFAADHVEDDVGAAVAGRLLGCGDEIFGLVVNGDIGAERDASCAFFRRPGSRDDPRAEGFGKLDGGRADAGRSAVDEQGFSGSEPAALEYIVPNRKEGFGDRGRLDRRKMCGTGSA